LILIQFIYLISEQSATAILPCSEGDNTTHNIAYKARDNTHKNQTQNKKSRASANITQAAWRNELKIAMKVD